MSAARPLRHEQRRAVGQVWLERARGELATAQVFEQVARAAREIGAVAEVVACAERASTDERDHAELCRQLAEQYFASPAPLACGEALDEAVFGDAAPELQRLLLLVYQTCINEGIAVTYLQENLRLVRAPGPRQVLRRLLRDELRHARIGWAHLASPALTAQARRHLAQALPTLLRLGRSSWLRPVTADLDCPEHGCLGHSRHAAIVEAALQELILPGFVHFGLLPR